MGSSSMASDLVVRIVERYLADHREVFAESNRLDDLMDCLDVSCGQDGRTLRLSRFALAKFGGRLEQIAIQGRENGFCLKEWTTTNRTLTGFLLGCRYECKPPPKTIGGITGSGAACSRLYAARSNWSAPDQFHGSKVSSRDAGWSLIRCSTSASHARGSTSFSLAVWISEYIAAARSPPKFEPANSHAL